MHTCVWLKILIARKIIYSNTFSFLFFIELTNFLNAIIEIVKGVAAQRSYYFHSCCLPRPTLINRLSKQNCK